jgi:heptosyltransferase-2
MKKFLIIQTAFIGDVVLATSVTEKVHAAFPNAKIDFLVRKGNESILYNNPTLNKILIWDKKHAKNKNLAHLLSQIRSTRYDKVINLQRYLSTGILTAFSGANETIGFDKNPLSFLFTKKIPHKFDPVHPRHEIEKNNDLIQHFIKGEPAKPKLYPLDADEEKIRDYRKKPFITMTPSSVWFTKQYPIAHWIELINAIDSNYCIYLLGGKDNSKECETVLKAVTHPNTHDLAGQLSILQSVALMKYAVMNYTNDSGPMHFASAVNAPVTAIFCSTVPGFGYTPLSDRSFIVETTEKLSCRPCGTHGHKSCPEKHFRCGLGIEPQQLLQILAQS